jgi:hypothetical protein
MEFRTDDLRIKEIKELLPPAHVLREFPITAAAARAVTKHGKRFTAFCMAPMTGCW